MDKGNVKKNVKKNYFNKRDCIIDNLIRIFLQIDCVKQKKYVFIVKQKETFTSTDVIALTMVHDPILAHCHRGQQGW